jgi:ABC transport system ATP-binding/permease protein
MADPIISATDLCLSYGHDELLDSASLAIHAGDKAGLVGRNGCGKSSFLRILAGDEMPEGGHISRRQGLVIGYLPQEFQLNDDLTVEQNIRAGAAELIAALAVFESGQEINHTEQERLQLLIDHADGWNLETRIETLMRKLNTPPADRIVANLSGGEKRRVGLARALVISRPSPGPASLSPTTAIFWIGSPTAWSS